MRSLKKATAIALLAGFAIAAPAVADEKAERLEIARTYIAHTMADMRLEKVADASIDQMLKEISKKQPDITDEKIAKLRGIARPIFIEAMEESMRGVDQTLATIFNLEELNALNDFVTSPTGRRVMRKMPQYSAALIPAIQAGIQKSIPELLQRFKEEGVKVQ